jgi:hypothetical protein
MMLLAKEGVRATKIAILIKCLNLHSSVAAAVAATADDAVKEGRE